jgi:3'-phosphoadenosine 5'-phosphosulfate sulfotransferase (PAPS reductase)/FAD synthetase
MTRHIYIILTVLLTACGTSSADKNGADVGSNKIDSTINLHTTVAIDNSVWMDTTDYDNATFFVVVADTSLDYSMLHKKMFDLNSKLKIPIDTMGRFYNETKNLIALPDDDEDEMYAGDYFPRRFPSDNLSLEYLDFYQRQAGEKTIALVTGIYETEKGADSAMAVLRTTEEKVFKIKADIYVGCMH